MTAPLPAIITPNAADDLAASWVWLRDRNPPAADEWLTGIRETILALGAMPDAHPIAPESRDFDQPIRRALYGKATRWRILLCRHQRGGAGFVCPAWPPERLATLIRSNRKLVRIRGKGDAECHRSIPLPLRFKPRWQQRGGFWPCGFHRCPGRLRNPGYPPRNPRDKLLLLCGYPANRRWLPEGVASQKSGPVASDVPRFARQHTNMARKEPEISGLAGWTPPGPRKPDRNPAASAQKAKRRANPSAHSPHLAFGIARTCCRCRREKCCNTLKSLTHSVAPRSWSAPAASAATRWCGRSPSPR
jgi:plasmid stabilization system protein ParE